MDVWGEFSRNTTVSQALCTFYDAEPGTFAPRLPLSRLNLPGSASQVLREIMKTTQKLISTPTMVKELIRCYQYQGRYHCIITFLDHYINSILERTNLPFAPFGSQAFTRWYPLPIVSSFDHSKIRNQHSNRSFHGPVFLIDHSNWQSILTRWYPWLIVSSFDHFEIRNQHSN